MATVIIFIVYTDIHGQLNLGIHSLLNSLLNNCRFLWFNRVYDCATTDLVKPMGLYNNRLFNKAVNCHLWYSESKEGLYPTI